MPRIYPPRPNPFRLNPVSTRQADAEFVALLRRQYERAKRVLENASLTLAPWEYDALVREYEDARAAFEQAKAKYGDESGGRANPVRAQGRRLRRRFTHDCDDCVFVGQFGEVDAYVHPPVDNDGHGGSIILRDGNEGHEYAATPLLIVLNEQRYPNDHPQIVLYRKVWRAFTTGRKS